MIRRRATAAATAAATPEALLRSRYAAFSLELPSYLAATTHPLHDDFDKDTAAWVRRLAKGLDASYFEGLRVLAQKAISDDEHEIKFYRPPSREWDRGDGPARKRRPREEYPGPDWMEKAAAAAPWSKAP